MEQFEKLNPEATIKEKYEALKKAKEDAKAKLQKKNRTF